MTLTGWVLLAATLLLVLGIILEGRRQERKFGKARGASLAGAGLMELQRHLEPERKIEILLRKEELREEDHSGDGPESGIGK